MEELSTPKPGSFNSTGMKKVLVNGRYTHVTEFNKEPPHKPFNNTDFGSKDLYKETTTGTKLD